MGGGRGPFWEEGEGPIFFGEGGGKEVFFGWEEEWEEGVRGEGSTFFLGGRRVHFFFLEGWFPLS